MIYIYCALDVGAFFALNKMMRFGISTFFHHAIGICLVLAKGVPTKNLGLP
jgi:hypothetical protein